jgi:hypothetical protein
MQAVHNLVARAIFVAAGGLCPGVIVGEWLSASVADSRLGAATHYNSYPWAKPARRDENVPERSVSEGDAQSCQEQEPVNSLLGVPRRTGRCRAPTWAQ